MNNWSEAFNSSYRTTWINCVGALLNLWSDSFFIKLGWMIREPLMIHEDTSKKRRLDRGRLLVLVNKTVLVSSKVVVKVGNCSVQMNLKEDDNPADWEWLENFLGLSKSLGCGNSNFPAVKSDKLVDELTEPKELSSLSRSPWEDQRNGYFDLNKKRDYQGWQGVRHTAKSDLFRVDNIKTPKKGLEKAKRYDGSRKDEGSFLNFKGWKGECSAKKTITGKDCVAPSGPTVTIPSWGTSLESPIEVHLEEVEQANMQNQSLGVIVDE
ncbi:hypothetical protein Q3G72_016800 [Acer saccharum]|nr:hypothetical protein Q3G72_016800 [Acer saccharum]